MDEPFKTAVTFVSGGGLASLLYIAAKYLLKKRELDIGANANTSKTSAEVEERRHKREEANTAAAYRRLDSQLQRVDGMFRDALEKLEVMVTREAQYREDYTEVMAWCDVLYQQSVRMHEAMVMAGLNPPRLIEPPEFKNRHTPDGEFELRQAAQNMELLREQIKPSGNGDD